MQLCFKFSSFLLHFLFHLSLMFDHFFRTLFFHRFIHFFMLTLPKSPYLFKIRHMRLRGVIRRRRDRSINISRMTSFTFNIHRRVKYGIKDTFLNVHNIEIVPQEVIFLISQIPIYFLFFLSNCATIYNLVVSEQYEIQLVPLTNL